VFVNGSAETQLVQFTNGIETLVSSGTEYETKLHADVLAQAWTSDEGFSLVKEGHAFEPLPAVIALARKLGVEVVYDNRFKAVKPGHPLNLTGAVPLKNWSGMAAKNGGSYRYALDGVRLTAQPVLADSLRGAIAPGDGAAFAKFMLNHMAALKAVGPTVAFVVSD